MGDPSPVDAPDQAADSALTPWLQPMRSWSRRPERPCPNFWPTETVRLFKNINVKPLSFGSNLLCSNG